MREKHASFTERLLGTLYAPSDILKVLWGGAVILGVIGVAWLVYTIGGVKFATLHMMYLPVIAAALVFGAWGGILAGLLGGLLIGPYMPLDTVTGEAQYAANWIYRTGFFCLMGGTVGAGVSALRAQLKAFDWLNEHDSRTGFLDGRGLLRTLGDMIERDRVNGRPFLIVVQIKNFLDIQNTLGPQFGERLLVRICERGRKLLPEDVPIAVLQSDRLAAVFAERIPSEELRKEVEKRFREPFEIDGVSVYADFAFGAAEYPLHGRSAEELLQKASIAMHTAVVRKRPFFFYDSALDFTNRENLVLLGMIPAALARNEFAVWYQAKFALATGAMASTEALLRWDHPQRAMIHPGNFIPQAEESGLINALTHWVVARALADKADWTAKGHRLGVAINLSVRNLHDRALLEALHETVSRHGIDPQQVELEITEGAVMDDFEYCAKLVSRLRDRGYRVSIDDFGTGQSSLAYLKNLPVCALKIDRTFVTRLATDPNDQKIVRTIVDLARSLNLESVAEGVEDEAALGLLRDFGCDYAQGFHLHRPAPYTELLGRLSAPVAMPVSGAILPLFDRKPPVAGARQSIA
jgi:EAL domain-containing protein (putative c-di-GMP-specific phosphodiesterase class I)/GGDEF domain-containing protein